MRNFEVTDKNTGKKYWISRSVAILAIVKVWDEPNGPQYRSSKKFDPRPNEKEYGCSTSTASNAPKIITSYTFENKNYIKNRYILINKRGEGCPNYKGYWNLVCGYLDWDESLKEAATREVLEECGVYIEPNKWNMRFSVDDSFIPGSSVQNVTIPFEVSISMEDYNKAKEEGAKRKASGEENEVDSVELMLLTRENLEAKDWAFNHKSIISNELVLPIHIFE